MHCCSEQEGDNVPIMELMQREEILALRDKLLARTGLSDEELMRRAVDYSLTPEQSAIAEEISDLDYLLEID